MHSMRGIQTAKTIGIGGILALNIFLFIPITLYIGNYQEITVSFTSIISLYLKPAIFLIALLALLGIVLRHNTFTRYLAVLAMICILLWLQGNLLVWDYGLLDGSSIDWNEDAWRGWLDVGIWIIAITFSVIANNRISKIIIRTAIVIFFLQLSLTLFTSIQNTNKFEKTAKQGQDTEALSEIYKFSSEKNVLHIIADGFQSDIFEELVSNTNEGNQFSNTLDGFVFFKENLGAFPYTHMSIPAILSGKIYKNHMPRDTYLTETMGGKTILNEAHRAGYKVDLAVPASLAHIYTRGKFDNAYHVPKNHHISPQQYDTYFAAKLFDLTLFRLAPHFLKKFIYNDQKWLFQSMLSNKKYMGLRFFSHTAFLNQLRNNMSVDRTVPTYKYIHLMLSHNPMVTNEKCEYAGRTLPTIRANVKTQSRCGLTELTLLLEKMKSLNIYDNTTIIIMADHGAWVRPKGLKGQAYPNGSYEIKGNNGTSNRILYTFIAQALPLMAIKPFNASGALRTSNALSSITDTPSTIADLLDLDTEFTGRSLFNLSDENRTRKYHTYKYKRSEWTDEYLSPIQEIIVNKSVYDTNNWQVGERFSSNIAAE